ncbi:MAG: MBL fold metallo-hydrolase [Erysipelotrichaceae bacterium]|nr:MBL fold metallo-hydrolase [Erysipelotrichaceae bacterium]
MESRMKLHKLSERIYYSDYEEERDRPALGYVKGDRFSVAVDAGHSIKHLEEFYELLKQENLPLPSLTFITHWHWDHTFAMHAVNGLTVALEETDRLLRDFIADRSEENDRKFLKLDPSIAREYEGQKLIVVPADITFRDKMTVDAGNVTINLFKTVSPHCDDAVLIEIPQEKVLFLGDAISGVFPDWIADPVKKKELVRVLEGFDVNTFIGAHWPVWTDREELIRYIEDEREE